MTHHSETDSSDRQDAKKGYERYFETEYLQEDLKGRSVRSGAITLVSQGVKFAITLSSTMLLARLLTPADYGLIAMVTVVSGFVLLFKDLGLSMATVQQADINHAQVSTLFWINVAIGLLFGMVVALLAFPLSWFYGEPRLIAVTPILAMGIPISGLGVQHQALLQRNMHFKVLALIEITAQVLSIAVTIALAYIAKENSSDYGYWALAAMPLVLATVHTIGVWIACKWRPGLPARESGVRGALSFGGYLSASRFINYISRNMDNLLIGYALGDAVLGLYNQAYRILLLPINQINTPANAVALPVLSRLVQNPERYRAFYRQGLLIILSASMPIIAFAFVVSDEIILFMFGEQWIEAAPIFRWLAPAAFAGTINIALSWVFISTGRTDRFFRISLVGMPCNVIGFVVGLYYGGAIGVAIAYSIVQCTIKLPIAMYCYAGSPVRLSDLGSVIWRPAIASLTAAFLTYLVNQNLAVAWPLLAELALEALVFGFSYVVITLILPGGRSSLRNTAKVFLGARKGPSKEGK